MRTGNSFRALGKRLSAARSFRQLSATNLGKQLNRIESETWRWSSRTCAKALSTRMDIFVNTEENHCLEISALYIDEDDDGT